MRGALARARHLGLDPINLVEAGAQAGDPTWQALGQFMEGYLDVLDAEGVPERFMMHCFSGDADFARQCLDRGAWLSFPGTVTFKPNHALREAFDLTPDDRLLVETDAPYLTPVPLRGRPNASYLMPWTVRFLAERRGADLAGFCRLLDDNATALFGGWGDDG